VESGWLKIVKSWSIFFLELSLLPVLLGN